MPKRDLQDSVVKKVEELAHSLKVVREDIRKTTNYERTLTTKILDYCELYGIENSDVESFEIEDVLENKPIPLKNILDVFPNDDVKSIVENIVAEIEIDLDLTEENLRYSGNFQDIIIKKITKQLYNLTKEKVKEVNLK